MFRLTNRLILEHHDRLSSDTDRAVVARDSADKYLDIESQEVLKDENGESVTPLTLLHTRDVDAFVKEGFIDFAMDCADKNKYVVIYCDDEAYVRLFTLWMKNLFPSVRLEDALEWNLMLLLNREASERNFSWESPYHTKDYVTGVFNDTPHSEALQAFQTDEMDNIHLFYRLADYLANGGKVMDDIPELVRQKLMAVISTNVRGIEKRITSLPYTPHYRLVTGHQTEPKWGEPNSAVRASGINVLSLDRPLDEYLQDREGLDALQKMYEDDLRTLLLTFKDTVKIENTIEEVMTPLRLLKLRNGKELVDEYIASFHKVDRFTLLVPGKEVSLTPFSVFMWFYRMSLENTPTPPACWST